MAIRGMIQCVAGLRERTQEPLRERFIIFHKQDANVILPIASRETETEPVVYVYDLKQA